MDWLEKLVDLGLGGLPGAALAVVPADVKARWRDRLALHDPLRQVSANHDLLRATRLAWTTAANDILVVVRRDLTTPDRRLEALRSEGTLAAIAAALREVRREALERDRVPGASPIDRHVESIVDGVPERVAPGAHAGRGDGLTDGFTVVLAELASCEAGAVPEDFRHVAEQGLPVEGGAPRRFGELVFAAFAELIKSPTAYPEAREAFHIAMDKVARDLAEATLDAVRGIDARLDAQLAALDALTVFRTGAEHHLALLPRIAEDTAATRQGVERIEGRLDTMPSQIVAELMAELDRRGEARAAEQAGLQRQAVIALARRNSANVDDFDQALRELERAVVIAIEAGATPARAGNLDAFVGQELARVAELSNAGRFDDAAAEAERAIARWEREEEERRKRALADGLALLEAGIRQDLLRRDAQAAAAKIARRVELEVADRAGLFQRLRAVGGEWFVWGRDGGLNLDLEVSIELARIAFEVAGDADERGVGLNELGTALSILGERETGTERLVEAIVTYRAALEEFTRERVPLDWAATQNNLGNAYRLLGERETGTERLEQAIVAYRAALEERTCERVPLDWAMTQTNLGAALSALGKRETGTESLEQAITAYRAALEEWTRERVPFQWATAQNNLGNALSDIGEREAGTERLEQAIAAYRAALEERTRERVPLDWAMTQNNLGNALSILGEREDSTERLEQAVAACRAALEEWTQERMPLKWAMTQNNLGAALRALGERETGTERLKQALAAYRAALEEWTRERVPLDWAMTQHNLGNALRVLGEREAGAERLEQALAAYRAALEERTPDRVPLDWAVSIGNQGRTMVKLAGRTGDAAMAADALSQIEAAHALCRNVGHDPYADVFAFYLPEARALVERLGLRPSAD